MNEDSSCDAIVIGSGPNGLSAAICLAQAGFSVKIYEAKKSIGGGMRSAEVTLPGFVHDICSAIHPLAISSPFFRSLSLEKHGLHWIQPEVPAAHPFDDGTAALLQRSIEKTGNTLGVDSKAYQELMTPLVHNWKQLANDILAPLHFPKHPWLMIHFAWLGARSALGLTHKFFKEPRARGFFAGCAAHAIQPLDHSLTAAFGLILAILGHASGWPMPQGGSQKIADALASLFYSLGGKIYLGTDVQNIDDLPPCKAILCDITPRQLLQIAGHRLPIKYSNALRRFRYGPGVFKVDWALSSPIPWKAASCAKAGTVHIGGTEQEIAFSERTVWEGKYVEKPYVIVAQPSLFDASRAPAGKHVAWGYCHVPNGSTRCMITEIENQIERFAPGFKECVLFRNTKTAAELEQYNSNYIGGDINGGVQDLFQLFGRPILKRVPYATPCQGLYICSSSTPPGGGVHGMCGYHAAHAALKQMIKEDPNIHS